MLPRGALKHSWHDALVSGCIQYTISRAAPLPRCGCMSARLPFACPVRMRRYVPGCEGRGSARSIKPLIGFGDNIGERMALIYV